MSEQEAALQEIRAAALTVLKGFDDGVFVRSIENDSTPEWAIQLLPYVQALGALRRAVSGVAPSPHT